MRRTLLCLALTVIAAFSTAEARQPRIVVSVAPIHSLTAAIMEDTGAEPQLLFSPDQFPQTQMLKPSQITALNRADLVIWVGPLLETGLAKPIATLPSSTARLRIAHLSGLTVWPLRNGGVWHLLDSLHMHTHREAQSFDSAKDPVDPHFWLDPRNAQVMVWAIADALAAADPDNALRYQANAQTVVSRLSVMDGLLYDRLEDYQGRPYLALHDAYQYAEHRYRLQATGAVIADPARALSAKRLAKVREHIREEEPLCLFYEPQSSRNHVAMLTEALNIRVVALDPYGQNLEPGPLLYPNLMKDLIDALSACLKE